jgi:hypothetical protein
MHTDELLRGAERQLRTFSSTRDEGIADEAYEALVRCYLPAVGADCPAYGVALTKCLDWLLEQRAASGWKPTV